MASRRVLAAFASSLALLGAWVTLPTGDAKATAAHPTDATAAPSGQAVAAQVPPAVVRSIPASLSIGRDNLPERRKVEQIAPGVVLTTITRGRTSATKSGSGPWTIREIEIDPAIAKGRLDVTYGPTLAGNDRTTALLREIGALVGINGSFYSPETARPGDPMGLTIAAGRVLSEPSGFGSEVTLLVDSKLNTLRVARLRWSANVYNPSTGRTLRIQRVNAAPVANQLTSITGDYGKWTPIGSGTEVVLDRAGCVVRVANTRGTTLRHGQSALQATGTAARRLRDFAAHDCLTVEHVVLEHGRRVELAESTSAMTGRVRLLRDGEVTAPDRDRYLFRRHPRTIAGTTWDGKIVMLTIDGRLNSSVGATMREAATIARDLGLRDAMNLDGGGSTTLAVRGKVVNGVRTERAVSDALVWVPAV